MSEGDGETDMFGGMQLSSKTTSTPTPSTGFSFMMNTHSTSVDQEEFDASTSVSAFSFMSPTVTAEYEPSTTSSSGFGFLSSPSPVVASTDDIMLGEAISTTPQEIKLAKVASAKAVVKKKKKSARVGFGRDEENDEDDRPTTQAPPIPVMPPPVAIYNVEISELPLSVALKAPALRPDCSPSPSQPPLPPAAAPTPLPPIPSIPQTTPTTKDFKEPIESTQSDQLPQAVAQLASTGASVLTGVMNMFRGNGLRKPDPIPATSSTHRSSPVNAAATSSTDSLPPSPKGMVFAPVPPPTAPPSVLKNASRDAHDAVLSKSQNSSPTAISSTAAHILSSAATGLPSSTCKPNEPAAALVLPSKPASAPTPVSIEDQASLLLQEFESGATAAARALKDLSRQIATTGQRAADKQLAVDSTEMRIKDIETEQAALAQAEDFERADALTGQLLLLRREVEATVLSIHTMRSSVVTLTVELCSMKEAQKLSLENLLIQLAKLQMQQGTEHSDRQRELEARQRGRLDRLRTEEERLSLEKKHIIRDQETLAEEAETTEAAISSQLGDDQQSRDALLTTLTGLEEEIAHLEELLQTKRNEAAVVRTGLGEAEARIGEVRRRYDRQLQRIADRKTALDSALSACEQEEAATAAERVLLADESALLNQKTEDGLAWNLGVGAELATGGLLLSSINMLPGWASAADSDCGVDESLQQKLDEALSLQQQAVSEASEVQVVLDLLLVETRDLDERLPKVDGEKKSHAAARRFKEAAQAAKDYKDLTTRREDVMNALSDTRVKVSVKAEEIQQCTEAVAACRLVLEAALAEAKKSKFIVLLKRAAMLRKSIIKIACEPEGGKSGLAVKRSAILVLEAELESVLDEAQAIQEALNLPDFDREALLEGESDNTAHVEAGTDIDDSSCGGGASGVVKEAGDGNDEIGAVDEEGDSPDINLADDLGSPVGSPDPECAGAVEVITPAEPTESAPSGLDGEVSEQSDDKMLPPPERVPSHSGTKIEAKSMLLNLDVMELEIEAAIAEEDYDRAAEVEETRGALKGQLDDILSQLGLTADDIRSYDRSE